MRIVIQAIPPEGYPFHGAARRMWASGSSVEVDVLDQEDDPPDFEQDLVNKHGERFRGVRPHPTQIGRQSYAELKADRMIRILSDKETTEIAAGAALTAAKAELSRLTSQVVDLQAAVATLEEQKKRLEGALASAQAERDAALHRSQGEAQAKGATRTGGARAA